MVVVVTALTGIALTGDVGPDITDLQLIFLRDEVVDLVVCTRRDGVAVGNTQDHQGVSRSQNGKSSWNGGCGKLNFIRARTVNRTERPIWIRIGGRRGGVIRTARLQ